MMERSRNQQKPAFVKIVYSQVNVKGKLQLVPMELYTDGSIRRSA